MRPVYAVQFRVQSAEGVLSFESLIDSIGTWIQRWYSRRKNLDIQVPTSTGSVEPLEEHSIEFESASTSSGHARLCTVSWSYPAEGDSRLLWRSDVAIAKSQEIVEFGLVLRIGSLEFKMAPPAFDVYRPQIVKSMTERYVCSVGGRTLGPTAHQIDIDDVRDFVELLESPSRRLPVVLCTRDPYSERFLASPGRLADVLVGLAHVYTLRDKWAAFRFTSEIGKQLACFNGAIRLYWPSRHPDGTLRADRPILPREVEELGDGVGAALMRRLAPISAFRNAELESARVLRAALNNERLAQASALRNEVASGRMEREFLEHELLKLVDEAEKLRSSLARAELERDDALLAAMELEEANAALRENFETISRYTASTEAIPPLEAEEFEPKSVSDALAHAAKNYQRLDVWSTAVESADHSDFARPAEVHQALLAIDELAEVYFTSKRETGPWADFFAERGFKYASTESQTTINMFGDERDFVRDGVKRRMLKHLTLGGGDKKNCLQIYFESDDAAELFSIGYCGRHLRTDKYRG